MKRVSYVIIAALACAVMASGAMADWTDDFESYTDNALLPIPPYNEDAVYNMFAKSSVGYSSSKGAIRNPAAAPAYGRGWAVRAAGGTVVTVTGRLKLQNLASPGTIGNGTEVLTGAIADTVVWDASPDNAWFAGNVGTDSLFMVLGIYSGNVYMTFWSDDRPNEANGLWDPTKSLRIIQSSDGGADLAVETWYDVKIEIDYVAGTAQGFYKRSTEPTNWTVMSGDILNGNGATVGNDNKLPIPLLNNQAGIYNPMVNAGICGHYYSHAVDDVAVVLGTPPVGDIAVAVNLEDYTGNLSANPLMRVKIQVLNAGGTPVATQEIAPSDTIVNYTFAGIPEGTYTVKASAPKWLTKKTTGVAVTTGGSTPVVLSLPNGDVDGDNTVDDADSGTVISNLDETGS